MFKRLALLLLIPGLAVAEPTQKGDFEQATAVGEVPLFQESQSGPHTIKDYTRHSWCRSTDQVRIVDRPVRNGDFATRMYLDDNHPSRLPSDITRKKERCSIQMAPNDSGGQYDETWWYAWSLLLPTTNQFEGGDTWTPSCSDAGACWMAHSQILYNDSNSIGQASIHLVPAGDNNQWIFQIWGGSPAVKTQINNIASLTKGVWHDFKMQVHWHHVNGSALTKLWHRTHNPTTGVTGDWALRVNTTNANIRWSGTPLSQYVMYWDLGLYRGMDQTNGTQVLYADGPWVGQAESDVIGLWEESGLTQLAAPANIAWDDLGVITWTQSGEENVSRWSASLCWDGRACVDSTVATKSVQAPTPFGKSLAVSIRANPSNTQTHSASTYATETLERTIPELPTNLTIVGTQIAATEISDGQTVTLSTEGTLDWVHWGLASVSDVNRKSGATTQIGALQYVGPTPLRFQVPADPAWPLRAWTGGTPTASEAGTRYALAHDFPDAVRGTGFRLTAPADAVTPRTLHLYVGVARTVGRLTATIDGYSLSETVGSDSTVTYWDLAVTYTGSGALSLDWIKDSTSTTSRVWLLGAALE